MPPFIDLTNQHFGRLTAQSFYITRHKKTFWICVCTCGNSTEVAASNLRNGHTQSCGCLQQERLEQARIDHMTHGMSGSAIYARWRTMLARCYRTSDVHYARYGARGITVCQAWRESFAAFYADMGDPPAGMQLERRDNNGPYAPENCYWATPTEQANNRRTTTMLTWQGKTQCLEHWAAEYGINPNTLRTRLGRRWELERALTTPAILTFRRKET